MTTYSNRALAYWRHYSIASVQDVPPPPKPKAGELLVKVHSASINPADFKSADGEQAALLSFNWPRVYGFDFAGVVVEVGSLETASSPDSSKSSTFAPPSHSFEVGNKVFGMIRGLPQLHRGTLARFVIVDADVCAIMPERNSFAECAAVPLVGITAVLAFRAMGLEKAFHDSAAKGNGCSAARVLILGGAGGVGSIAIQIAKHVYKAGFVCTTASAGGKTDLCLKLGADRVIDYRSTQFEQVLSNGNGGYLDLDDAEAFDYILDTTGEVWRARNLVKRSGSVCSIIAHPTTKGILDWLESSKIPSSSMTIGVGSFLQSAWGGSILNCLTGGRAMVNHCRDRRGGATYVTIIGRGDGLICADLADWLKTGQVSAVIDEEFELERAAEAVEKLRAGRVAGKLIVNVEPVES